MSNEEFIRLNRNQDVRTLALKRVPEGVDASFCLRQIEGWQIARHKLPRWADTDGLLYPPRLSMEQCSSERTASYKCSVVERLLPEGRQLMADLTGGFGIDFSYLAPLFVRSVYVERQDVLCRIAQHNLPLLGVKGATVCHSESEDALVDISVCDFLFLDPARRDDAGRKVVALEDCSPDVARLAPLLLEKAEVVMLKLSPMLDIHEALRILPDVCEVHVVSVDGECKELLLVLRRGTAVNPVFHCVNIGVGSSDFCVESDNASPSIAERVGMFLYEPNASVLKAGVQDALCERFGVVKLHPFSHLFTSEELVECFPGRSFRVVRVCGFGKRELKELVSSLGKANLAVRNFPATVAELRKKWKLKEGGDDYLFATTLNDGSRALILCQKV